MIKLENIFKLKIALEDQTVICFSSNQLFPSFCQLIMFKSISTCLGFIFILVLIIEDGETRTMVQSLNQHATGNESRLVNKREFYSDIDWSIDWADSTESKTKTSGDRATFDAECLKKHNYYRSLHGVEPLTIDSKLSEVAQDWADHLASVGSISHRPNNKYGENIYWISLSDIDGETPVKAWYDEISMYSYDQATFKSGTGHFTQVIWKGSKQLGIGKSSSSRGTFIVCNYNPAGNYLGRFKENVLPVKKS
ncbi:Golgi-associated plant pathogenesis-related protein 1-like isoform X2 [Tetranychus urticae]|uniref:Golgi-associated plant pathogenesis-related protein 1-like isoform X2 n=1 Tax=Tetranychus urticae TaxID=32264 RepID=UPI00077C02DF|nr:Golgi-associated plant pathogenesis-related protein 1-like isoform X2 [Tetranychus urticae]